MSTFRIDYRRFDVWHHANVQAKSYEEAREFVRDFYPDSTYAGKRGGESDVN